MLVSDRTPPGGSPPVSYPNRAVPTQEDPAQLWIVDDEADFRRLVRRVAEPQWSVTEFPTGVELLSSLDEFPEPDLIILDIVMPEMDGIEVVEKLIEDERQMNILIVSGNSPVYASTAAMLGNRRNLRVVGALSKPIPLSDLRSWLAVE